MNRRKFLKLSGSLAVGGAILSVVGHGLWKMFTYPDQLFYGTKVTDAEELLPGSGDFVSPYRRTFGFVAPDRISAFDVEGGNIYVGTSNNIYVYGLSGELQTNFSIPSGLRDLAIYDGQVYVLFPTRVQVYDRQGEEVRSWEACSENSDYCSLAVGSIGVFVTDAANKNICKYNLDGTLSRFITSPDGFVVPSYSFGVVVVDDKVFCSNPGRHRIEQYTAQGDFVSSFGQSGAAEGAFSGCCNPVGITSAHNGELLTSEKGIPRISCYTEDGKFRSVLLDSKALGGGHDAYEVRIMKDKLIVAGGDKVSVFQYRRDQSQHTACGQCDKDCPLKI